MYYKAILNYRKTSAAEDSGFEYATRVDRDMGFSESEFNACLPMAVAGAMEQINQSPGHFEVSHTRYHAVIRTQRKPTRHLGSLALPVLGVSIEFSGKDEQDFEAFMEKFDRHFLRMGG